MGKRGQFTVFVILGFILLVVVLFTLFIVSMIQDANINEQARRAVNDYIDASSINYYIYTCMDKVVNEAVLEMAKQGGVFWDEENYDGPFELVAPGDTHIPITNVAGEEIDVSYSLLGDYACTSVYLDPPLYPFPSTYLVDLRLKYYDSCRFSGRDMAESGVFGYNSLTRLCNINSDNFLTQGVPSVCVNDVTAATLEQEKSIENQLEKMLVKKMNECTGDFAIFEEIGGHKIRLISEPSAKIIYGKNDFAVKFNYPFEVKIRGKEPVVVRKDFEYASKLKLVALHTYLLDLIKREVQYPFFDIAQDYASLLNFNHDHYTFELIDIDSVAYSFVGCEAGCDWENDYIIKIEDNSSEATGKYLTFYVAFHNRRPALDWIHETGEGIVYDYIVFENDLIEIKPLGLDPENKEVAYTYSGWKETFDTEYSAAPECNPPTPNTWEKFIECGNYPATPPLDLPKWSVSNPYIANQKDAEYTVKASDAGLHYTRITTTDEAQLQDWQEVSILVIDQPNIEIGVQNIVPNVPENVVSIEDPFRLDSTGTSPSTTPGITISGIEWTITNVINNLVYTVFNLPQPWSTPPPSPVPIPYSEGNVFYPQIWNINLIKPRILKDSIEHEITLSVTQTSTIPGVNTIPPFSETEIVQVKQCIPYHDGIRNPFPYSGYDDPIDSRNYAETIHACCSGDITDPNNYALEGTGTTCFSETWYGEKNELVAKANELMKTSLLIDYYTIRGGFSNINSFVNSGKDNDVYKLYFERKCDGQRGNICAGDGDYVLNVEDSCTAKPLIQEETCTGPPENPSTSTLSCVNYGAGTTYESLFGTGTGVCETTPRCSSSLTYNSQGPFWTAAHCNGLGGCTRPAALTCSVANCGVATQGPTGAECDATNTFRRNGDLCDYGCSGTCKFSVLNSRLPCTGNSCFNPNFNGESACFTNVACSSSGPIFTRTSYCAARGTILTYGGDRYCYWHNSATPPTPPNLCTATGTCLIYSMSETGFINSNGPCPAGQTRSCNAQQGWICI